MACHLQEVLSMFADDIIEAILEAEGPGDPRNGFLNPNDRGGRTNWGISEKAHPEEWANGKIPSRERAKQIYKDVYYRPFATVPDGDLQAQLTDWCVLHGEGRTWKWLKRVLNIKPEMPNEKVLAWLSRGAFFDFSDLAFRLLNNALVAARLKLIDEISDADVKQKANEEGWENRAHRFLQLG
jgi:lysozyme family protein